MVFVIHQLFSACVGQNALPFPLLPAPRFAAIKSGSTEPVSFSEARKLQVKKNACIFGAMEDIRNDKHLAMDLYMFYIPWKSTTTSKMVVPFGL